jgi:hypothetical protein
MEAKCCENAIAVTTQEIFKEVVSKLLPQLAAVEPEKRKEFVKILSKTHIGFTPLLDLL